jgi:hypothetical protein
MKKVFDEESFDEESFMKKVGGCDARISNAFRPRRLLNRCASVHCGMLASSACMALHKKQSKREAVAVTSHVSITSMTSRNVITITTACR